ncbi:MAG: DUF406 family protein [Parashewanella sp.]
MKVIKEAQVSSVNDTCNTCGAFADIGAVINENDTRLLLVFTGKDAEIKAEELADAATQSFTNVQCDLLKIKETVQLKIDFDVAAEKMIFQLRQGLS